MRDKLAHIVEKRADSRERYVRHAIDTLTGPFEIWRVAMNKHRQGELLYKRYVFQDKQKGKPVGSPRIFES